MGYTVLHLEKAKGNDAGMSAHIERTIHPKNADESRTHLNRELIKFPEGVETRTQAIQHRLDTATLKRKIGTNQVRAIRIMLSGTPEDMQQIEQSGKLDDWCNENLDWLKQTYGEKNLVSAVIHLDEKTPHIHATVVPIVTGERRKAKQEQQSGKKKYKKKNTESARLCADDIMARDKLKAYQDSYAERMQKYGLHRGIEGSEAKHISTAEYYRDLSLKNKDLQEDIEDLQEQKTEVKEKIQDLYDRKDEARDKFLSMDGHVKQKLEELSSVEDKLEQARHELDPNNVREDFNLVRELFPKTDELLKWGKFCLNLGFSKSATSLLVNENPIKFSGSLYSNEYEHKFLAEQSVAKLEQDTKEPGRFRLLIDGLNIIDWFRQKYREFQKSLGVNIKRPTGQKKNTGIGF